MPIVNKPQWWNKLSNFFVFSNDASATIDSDVLMQTLDDFVEGQMARMMTPSFIALGSVVQAASGSINSSNILIPTSGTAELVLGYGGVDYLSGTVHDNILHGGTGNDFFGGSAGIDLIIGSDETPNIHEKDTIGYLMATTGIVVNATIDPSTTAPNLMPNQDVYSFSYADFLNNTFPRVLGFQTGPGGDIIDVSALLAAVGYTGSNAVADGFVRFSQNGTDLRVFFDQDGFGSIAPRELIRLQGTSSVNFSLTHNLVTSPLNIVMGEPNVMTFVSNDGQGAYDILYSVENIVGSSFDDVINGHSVQSNILSGASGNDFIDGLGGADILIGGRGNDTVYGGSGNDLIILGQGGDQVYGGAGSDTFDFDGSLTANIAANTHTIWDFQTGAGGDRIDVTEILLGLGYAGSNAVADGFVSIVQNGLDTHIRIDTDGAAGSAAGQDLAILRDVDATQFSTLNNLVTAAPKTLYISVLGQSNAEGLRVLGSDPESGITRIATGLDAQTDYNQIAIEYRDENGSAYVPAIGSTRVVGDYGGRANDSWWFPSTNRPGEILVRAVEMLTVQIAEARANGAVKPVIVWGQGEGDCVYIGAQTTPAARLAAQQVYKNATLAVFDYIKAQVGDDVTFYIMKTGRYGYDAAIAGGNSVGTATRTRDGLPFIREAQEQMALERADVFVATDYVDLPMAFEFDPVGSATDAWHFHPETREIIGDRIADFIALNLGQDHILDNPGAYPIHMLFDLNLKGHVGMVINGNANANIVAGTLGNDTLTGGGGNDTLYGGAGVDTAVYTLTYANYVLTQGTYLTVAAQTGSEGTDTLVAMERVEFADGVYENGVFTPYVIPNNPPVAKDDVFTGEQDQTIAGNVLLDNGNNVDFDTDNDPLTVVAGVFLTDHGSVTINADGTFLYTPNAGFFGIDSFDYTLEDGRGGSDTGTVFLTLNPPPPPNNDPVAQDDVFTGLQDANILGNVLANNGNGVDSDPDGDPITVLAGTITTANGTVTINGDGTFTYTPNAGFNGTDSFNYTVQDSRGGSDIGLVTLTINPPPPNNAPIAQDDAFTGAYNTAINGNVLVNNGNGPDTDPDGDPLTVVAGTFATANGNITLTANGGFTYTPNAGFSGLDTYEYTLEDGRGGTDTGLISFTVNPLPPNNPPVAKDDAFNGQQDTPVNGNVLLNNGNGVDTDPDGNALNVVSGTFATTHGSVTMNADGTFIYTPNAGFFGIDGFDYTLQDGQGGQDTGSVFITVAQALPPNTNPVAYDDAFSGNRVNSLTGNVLVNNGNGADFDADGDALNVVAGVFATANGSINIAANGSFTYTRNAGFFGTDTFDYTLQDGRGGNDTGRIHLTITDEIIGTNNNDNLSGTTGNDIMRGLNGNDIIKGREGNDTIFGGDGADNIEGNAGNDILYGGLGADIVKGGEGMDTFAYLSMSEAGDTISDFRRSLGDKIDISEVLTMYDPNIHAITDFVRIENSGTNSTLSIDVDGGGDNFVLLATLTGVTNLTDEQALVNSGHLIV